jgi:hypothetical protein
MRQHYFLCALSTIAVSLLSLGLLLPSVQAAVVYDLKYDGGDRVIIPNSSSLNPSQITVETRVKLDRVAFGPGYSGTDCQYFVCKGGESYDGMYGIYQGWGTSANSTRLGFSIEDWGGAGHLQTYLALEVDRWYHVAGTYDGNTMRLYLDGSLLKSKNVGSYTLGNSKPLYFGYMDNYWFPYRLTGLMDEVRIWDYARTTTEIQETMNRSLSGAEAGLVGLWNFDEPLMSQNVIDSTANNNDGWLGSYASADSQDPHRVAGDPLAGPIPEPCAFAVWSLMGLSFIGLRWFRRRKAA